MTYTYVLLDVSRVVYEEIRQKLLDAGYDHAIHSERSGKECLDMYGIALAIDWGPGDPVICGCRVPSGYIPTINNLNDPAPDCPFCDGTGILKRTVPL